MAAIIELEARILEVNNDLIDLWGKIDEIELEHTVNQRLYIRTIAEMDARLAAFQMTNWALLETIKNRQVEHYWAKYIKKCKAKCDEIRALQMRQQEINASLKEYLKQCRLFRQNRPDDKVELARLTKIQKKINNDAIALRFDKDHYFKFFVVDIPDVKKIEMKAVALFENSTVYWGTMDVNPDNIDTDTNT